VKTYDVAIIGAGIVGLSAGYWLAKQGARVVVLERGRVASEASSRAIGFQSLRGENPPEIPLAAAANELWHTMDDELGYPTEWTPSGRLWVALDESEYEDFRRSAELWKQQNLPVGLIDAAEARKLVPPLTDRVVGGLYTTRGGHANPQRSSQAFGWAFLDRGGEIREQTAVLGIDVEGEKVVGVRTASGLIAAGVVVNCAGPQIGLLSRPLGVEVPLAAARLEAAITTPLPKQFDVAMVGNGLSVRQTKRGNIIFDGGPHEWINVELASEPAKPSTPVMQGESRRVLELLPVLATVALLRTWGGVVEVSPDHCCILDRPRSPQGLVIVSASGHGIGLAPALGRAVSEVALTGRSSVPVDGLSLARFHDLDPNWAQSRRWVVGQYNT
jgi:sarcosine oxidase subunit beta